MSLWGTHHVYKGALLAQQRKGTCPRSNNQLGLFACFGLSALEIQLFIERYAFSQEVVSQTSPSMKASEHDF